MIRSMLIVGALGALACGSSPNKNTQDNSRDLAVDGKSSAGTRASSDATPDTKEQASTAPKVAVSPSPIKLPNAIVYDGYIVGGLPSKADIDSALAQDIETAMSLMGNDEEGIAEIGPYAAAKGFRYIRFTIAGKEDLNESMAWQFASTLPLLEKPGIVHSAKGTRVAAIFALMAFFVDELSAEESLEIGKALGLGDLEDHVRSLLELPPK